MNRNTNIGSINRLPINNDAESRIELVEIGVPTYAWNQNIFSWIAENIIILLMDDSKL